MLIMTLRKPVDRVEQSDTRQQPKAGHGFLYPRGAKSLDVPP